jgi:hypothetical protein
METIAIIRLVLLGLAVLPKLVALIQQIEDPEQAKALSEELAKVSGEILAMLKGV